MKENIETKDVQRTEYLNKNGLDMLWAKVKENTRNQVEVEYNRAKAKEDSLSQEIASIKPSEDKSYIQAKLTSKDQDSDNCYYDVAGQISFKSEYSDSYGGVINSIDKNGINVAFDNDSTFGSTGKLKVGRYNNYNIVMQGNGRLLHDTRDTFNEVSMQLLENADTTYANSMDGNSMLISQLGIFYTSQGYALTSNDLLTGHGDYKTIGTDIAPLENGKVPAKYLDLPQIDTSDFVSKTATDAQSIKSELSVSNTLSVVDSSSSEPVVMLGTNGDDSNFVMINPKNEEKVIWVTPTHIQIGKDLENSMFISRNSIQSPDNDMEHVFTTAGTIANLFEYVRKENIGDGLNINDDGVVSVDTTAISGGNVDDVQVNGVTVVENKIANIKPATKENLGVVKVGDGLNITDGTISVDTTAIGSGNYIPYARYEHDEYVMLNNIKVEGDGSRDALCSRIGRDGLSVYKMTNGAIHSNIQCAEIELQSDKNRVRINDDGIDIWKLDVHAENGISYYLLGLSKDGVTLYGGDDNHVLTSNASTIDITQYALKSVYDEKIAALEARIAALEAIHTK